VVLAGAAYFFLLYVSSQLDVEAEQSVVKYAKAIQEYKHRRGKYPEGLTQLNIERKNLLVVIRPSKIHMVIDQGKIRLYYLQFPLGPAHVYDLTNRSWDYEEI